MMICVLWSALYARSLAQVRPTGKITNPVITRDRHQTRRTDQPVIIKSVKIPVTDKVLTRRPIRHGTSPVGPATSAENVGTPERDNSATTTGSGGDEEKPAV